MKSQEPTVFPGKWSFIYSLRLASGLEGDVTTPRTKDITGHVEFEE